MGAEETAKNVMKRVSEDLDINEILSATNVDRLPRKTGSVIPGVSDRSGQQVLEWLKSLEWTEKTEEVVADGASYGMCRYFRAAPHEGQTGILGATSLDEVFRNKAGMSIDEWDQKCKGKMRDFGRQLGQEVLNKCELVWGQHGPEIVMGRNSAVPTREVWLIIGHGEKAEKPASEMPVLYTWHPGPPIKPVMISKANVKFTQ